MDTTIESGDNKYLAFTIADTDYAVQVRDVKEVLEYSPLTKIPKSSRHLLGVINLREKAVPVIDLRSKLELELNPDMKTSSILILDEEQNGDESFIGALTDSVQSVIEIVPDDIEPAQAFSIGMNTRFIQGIGKYNDAFYILLNIQELLHAEEAQAS